MNLHPLVPLPPTYVPRLFRHRSDSTILDVPFGFYDGSSALHKYSHRRFLSDGVLRWHLQNICVREDEDRLLQVKVGKYLIVWWLRRSKVLVLRCHDMAMVFQTDANLVSLETSLVYAYEAARGLSPPHEGNVVITLLFL